MNCFKLHSLNAKKIASKLGLNQILPSKLRSQIEQNTQKEDYTAMKEKIEEVKKEPAFKKVEIEEGSDSDSDDFDMEEKEDKRIDCRVGHNRHPNYRLKFDISIQCDSGQLFIPTIIALKRAIFFGVKS